LRRFPVYNVDSKGFIWGKTHNNCKKPFGMFRKLFSWNAKGSEERIFLQISAVFLLSMILLTINTAVHHSGITPTFFGYISCLTILLFFYLANKQGQYLRLLLPGFIVMLILFDVSWVVAGQYGVPLGIFLLVIIIFASRQQRHTFTSVALINTIIIFTYELSYNELLQHIQSDTELVGYYLVLIVCALVVANILIRMKNGYEVDKIKSEELNYLLTQQKSEIEKKSAELELSSQKCHDELEAQRNQLATINADLREQNASLEQFTYILSHNIRSPINQLRGLFSLLPENFTKDKSVIETLQRMRVSAEKLGEVISDLSKTIDIRKNKSELFEPVSLTKQLILAIATLDDQIKASSAEVDLSSVDDLSIEGIDAYVLSIFFNLIHNSIKYASPERKPRIVVTIHEEADQVCIRVQDNGIGIDLERAKSRIFQLYQRFNTEADGKGFGLFLIKTQVTTMRGKVAVESTVGEGTTFIITFPKLTQQA
jgi:signal transduction histidine kinase